MSEVLIIELFPLWTECRICGVDTLHKWGVPVDTNGDVVPNWFEGEWGGISVCEPCFKKHEEWSSLRRPSS